MDTRHDGGGGRCGSVRAAPTEIENANRRPFNATKIFSPPPPPPPPPFFFFFFFFPIHTPPPPPPPPPQPDHEHDVPGDDGSR